uniref:Knottin scorpion toxin-like domain-containing protein n=1 Tax=Setaria italica TaxID=4555 RepID=K3ZKG4_SETIT
MKSTSVDTMSATMHSILASACIILVIMSCALTTSTYAAIGETCYGTRCVKETCDLSCRTRFDETYAGSACKSTIHPFQECCCYYEETPFGPPPPLTPNPTWQQG